MGDADGHAKRQMVDVGGVGQVRAAGPSAVPVGVYLFAGGTRGERREGWKSRVRAHATPPRLCRQRFDSSITSATS